MDVEMKAKEPTYTIPRPRAVKQSPSEMRPPLPIDFSTNCLQCGAEMRYDHGQYICDRCHIVELGCCEGQPQ